MTKDEALKLAQKALTTTSYELHSEWGGPSNGEIRLRELEHKAITAIKEALAEPDDRLNAAYRERNQLVALLSTVYPSVRCKTAIEGWDEAWHGCVYIKAPWGQASWHYHNDDAWMFAHLPQSDVQWDGHTTEEKYTNMAAYVSGALAEPQQIVTSDNPNSHQPEPVAWMYDEAKYPPTDLRGRGWLQVMSRLKPYMDNGMVRKLVPLYTTPPQRPWIGLTDDKIDELRDAFLNKRDLIASVEVALRSKNT